MLKFVHMGATFALWCLVLFQYSELRKLISEFTELDQVTLTRLRGDHCKIMMLLMIMIMMMIKEYRV